MDSFRKSGRIVDLIHSRIFSGTITVKDGKIDNIREEDTECGSYILPGFIDSHVHVESSMLTPSEFARIAVRFGNIGAVCDPHEIANVLGTDGILFMLDNSKKVPFRFLFGAPSCVPATPFETSGARIDHNDIARLMSRDDIAFLGEMMNYPGVISGDSGVHAILEAARKSGKPIDGHAPGLTGDDMRKYVAAGISTDHECYSIAEAEGKIEAGMKIHIREGSAAMNFDSLVDILRTHPDKAMFCTDDNHPNDLPKGYINLHVRRALAAGYNVFDVLRAASLNPARHYGIKTGFLQQGDPADFIVADNLTDLNILETYIGGHKVAENGTTLIPHIDTDTPNIFNAQHVSAEDFKVEHKGRNIKVIECIEHQLITKTHIAAPKVENGNIVSDTERDILKMAVVNRYTKHDISIGFIKNFGLKKGAIASSIAHDSHNIIAVGTSDEELAAVINKLIDAKGGVVAGADGNMEILELPVAGLMSNSDADEAAEKYIRVNAKVRELGSTLYSPFITLSFMSLLVIPELKLGDKGLFDVTKFAFTDLYE